MSSEFQPYDHDSWGARWNRFWCWLIGHEWLGAHKPPIIDLFLLCSRCGKFVRIDVADVAKLFKPLKAKP